MTIHMRLVNTLTTINNGAKVQLGEVEAPFDKAISSDYIKGTKTLAASGSAELFDGSETDPFTTASVIWIRSDRDCVVQLTFDTAGTYGKELQTRHVKGSGEAGVMGAPLVEADCKAYAGYTEDFAAGTLVYCDRVTIENTDSSNAAEVEFFIGD